MLLTGTLVVVFDVRVFAVSLSRWSHCLFIVIIALFTEESHEGGMVFLASML